MNGSESMDAIQFGSIDHRGQGSVGVCSPFGAETADDLAMNDRRTQSTFADIVGRRDIAAVQEYEQTLAMLLVAALKSTGIRGGQGCWSSQSQCCSMHLASPERFRETTDRVGYGYGWHSGTTFAWLAPKKQVANGRSPPEDCESDGTYTEFFSYCTMGKKI